MKIHDKEALVMTILDVVAIALAIWYMIKREVDICSVAVLLYACLGLKTNITAVFFEEASKKRKKQVANLKKAYRNVFGRFAPLAPFSFVIFLGVGALLLNVLKGSMLGIYVMIFGAFTPMLIDIMVRTEMGRVETEQE